MRNNHSQQPLKSNRNVSLISYEEEKGLKQGALTNGEMESSQALIEPSPADTLNLDLKR